MTREQYELLSRIHADPENWFYSMGISRTRLPAMADGCKFLLETRFSSTDIKRALQRSPTVLDALRDKEYATAATVAAEVLSKPRRDTIDPESGEWIEVPDDTPIVDGSGRRIGTLETGIFPGVTPTPSAEDQIQTLRQKLEEAEKANVQLWRTVAVGAVIFAVLVLARNC
jgi:hypothetical protein